MRPRSVTDEILGFSTPAAAPTRQVSRTVARAIAQAARQAARQAAPRAAPGAVRRRPSTPLPADSLAAPRPPLQAGRAQHGVGDPPHGTPPPASPVPDPLHPVNAAPGAACRVRSRGGVLDTVWAWHMHGLRGRMRGLIWGEPEVRDMGAGSTPLRDSLPLPPYLRPPIHPPALRMAAGRAAGRTLSLPLPQR